MFSREKKAGLPFILFGLFDPEGLGAGTGLIIKRKRLDQPRQTNVLEFNFDSNKLIPAIRKVY
ncbi:hypothetical protein ACQCVP_12780 [Rossellomorea vietnamensis]|uniref:hypothetical protein n=1 Tax=Rossellomorea vietnamensis TaxID=218284 RepID=UPI003CF79B49